MTKAMAKGMMTISFLFWSNDEHFVMLGQKHIHLYLLFLFERDWTSFQVIELGGTPTIGDCAVILRAAIRAPLPSAFLKILQTTHTLGYVFGR